MNKMKSIALILALSATLAACGQQVAPQPQYEQPVVQAPQPQAEDGFDAGDAALGAAAGAAAGYMLGNSGSRERTVYIDNRRPNYGYSNGYNRGYGKKVTTTTTVIKKGFGGKTAITKTKTTTKRRR